MFYVKAKSVLCSFIITNDTLVFLLSPFWQNNKTNLSYSYKILLLLHNFIVNFNLYSGCLLPQKRVFWLGYRIGPWGAAYELDTHIIGFGIPNILVIK